MSLIAFIGKPNATPDECSALNFLGQILAHQEVDLVINDKGNANRAVLAGYEDRGGSADVGPGIFHENPDQLIVFTDDDLTTILDDKLPDWRRCNSIVMTEDEELYAFLDLLVAKISNQTGITLTQE